jgi:hypothetical protein
MLTKKEWCVLVLAGCLVGETLAGATIMVGWVMQRWPVAFWASVCVGCASVLLLIAARNTEAGRERRHEIYGCCNCGELFKTLDKYLAHRCGR